MKKFLLAFIVVLLLVAAGYNFLQKKESIPQEAESALEKMIGVVSSSKEQALLNAPTPFLLTTDAGEKIHIDSINVNLKKYSKRRVEVEGAWNDGRTIFNIEDIVSLGRDTQSKQAFLSSDMGLKFSYPTVWSLTEGQNITGQRKIILTPYEIDENELQNINNIAIEMSENNRRLTAREWLELDELFRPQNSADQNVYQKATVGLAQLDAVKKTYASENKVEFYASRDLFMYKFAFSGVNDSDEDVSKNVFYELIAGFEFVPFTTSAGTSTPQLSAALNAEASPPLAAPLAAETIQVPAETIQTPPAQQTQNPSESSNSQLRTTFGNYISSNISSLAPEPAENGTWQVNRLEFSYPGENSAEFNAIYVVYGDNNSLRKILLSVPDRASPQSMSQVAYFKPGESTDWQLVTGTDIARSQQRTVVTVGAESQETVVRSGMRLLESRSFGIRIQYPSNWYWAFNSGGYNFSNRPLSAENVLLRLTKNPEVLPDTMAAIENLGGKPAQAGEWAESLTVCVQGEAKYCLSGSLDQRATMMQMLETLQE